MAKNELTNSLTVRAFFRRFPDDDACLSHLMAVRFGMKGECPKCHAEATFHRVTERKAFECSRCRGHIYPQADTIFQDSRTSLVSWFFVVYLFTTTRHGVSGKEIQRQLGCTYKCAYRMGMQVRKLMAKADIKGPLSGHIELDEAFIGGRSSNGAGNDKTTIFGMAERNGAIRAEVVPNRKMPTLRESVLRNVQRGSVISTDEAVMYGLLPKDGYRHGKVNHSRYQWSWYDDRCKASHHTNTLESFWRTFKKSVASTHISISPKHTQTYVNEFAMRANYSGLGNAMFDLLLASA